jgi:hypothetical protein
LNRIRRINSKRNQHKFNFDSLAVPVAFINGLFFGGYALRKIRQYWEGGPTD